MLVDLNSLKDCLSLLLLGRFRFINDLEYLSRPLVYILH